MYGSDLQDFLETPAVPIHVSLYRFLSQPILRLVLLFGGRLILRHGYDSRLINPQDWWWFQNSSHEDGELMNTVTYGYPKPNDEQKITSPNFFVATSAAKNGGWCDTPPPPPKFNIARDFVTGTQQERSLERPPFFRGYGKLRGCIPWYSSINHNHHSLWSQIWDWFHSSI